MKLEIIKRKAEKKSELNKLRREGYIPAVIYAKSNEGETFALKSNEFGSLLRQVQPGRLSTTKFNLVAGGKERTAIIKEIQYHPTTYNVLHLDFEELIDDVPINVKVPLGLTGVVDCIGVKLGGVIRQVIRYVKVRCLAKDMPTAFTIDVKNLNQREARRLSDIQMPETVRPIADLKQVAVSIVKR